VFGKQSDCFLFRPGYRDSQPVQKQLPRPLDYRRGQLAVGE